MPLSVITAAGTLFSPAPFTYVQLSIASVSPNQGIYSGGTAITITGSFLNGATSVKVGGVPATDVVAVNSTTVTAVTPAGSVGVASVEVTGAKVGATDGNDGKHTKGGVDYDRRNLIRDGSVVGYRSGKRIPINPINKFCDEIIIFTDAVVAFSSKVKLDILSSNKISGGKVNEYI